MSFVLVRRSSFKHEIHEKNEKIRKNYNFEYFAYFVFFVLKNLSTAYCLIHLCVFRFDFKRNFAVFAGEFDVCAVKRYGFDLAENGLVERNGESLQQRNREQFPAVVCRCNDDGAERFHAVDRRGRLIRPKSIEVLGGFFHLDGRNLADGFAVLNSKRRDRIPRFLSGLTNQLVSALVAIGIVKTNHDVILAVA